MNPSMSGKYPMEINGRVIDLHDLEKYIINDMSLRSICSDMRYNEVKRLEDVLWYGG